MESLKNLLTLEQQALLVKHLEARLNAGDGRVILQVHRGRVYRIGQEFFEEASQEALVTSQKGTGKIKEK
jgi:hypothetical protein